MSTHGSFNSKSPTLRRILKEASELATNPSTDYHASPLEDNLFEWHFTLRGPPEPSPYANGLYHGRIVLPTTYPLRPPSFRFLTPSGRFEANREICLSISGHHEETWQPAWGIRTALVAIRSFMDTDAKGQLGGLQCDDDARRAIAKRSPEFTCPTCQRSNRVIMEERAEEVRKLAEDGKEVKEEVVPEELRLAYRESLGPPAAGDTKGAVDRPDAKAASEVQSNVAQVEPSQTQHVQTGIAQPVQLQPARPLPRASQDRWVDLAIYGIAAVLALLVARKMLSILE
ncbi:UBC-like protein [Tothia fuscella]|uniref:UBC-like protein n=1 Tax=Tothia fuscella TaxID=1048955 RepID=A0A9P4TY86_9PEZI|nr:UBC-like protein [Tothia fuscella]